MRIHRIQTGEVAIKKAHYQLIGPAATRIPSILLDPRWTDWLPMNTWVIEHPEGVIVIDTGETSRTSEPDFFACADPGNAFILRNMLRYRVQPEQEIGNQLRDTLGIAPEDVRTVILTHMHSDHTNGLSYFPNAEVLIARGEYETAFRNPRGDLTCRLPEWLAPTLVDYQPVPFGTFERSYPVTQDGRVVIVPTHGHSEHHQSVMLKLDDVTICFAGDMTFTEDQLLKEEIGGISEDVSNARESIKAMKRYIAQNPTVYLPTHDPASASRFDARQITRL